MCFSRLYLPECLGLIEMLLLNVNHLGGEDGALSLCPLVGGWLFADHGWRRRREKQLQGRCEDEDSSQYGRSEEGPQEDPVQHLGHKLPVLHHLKENMIIITQRDRSIQLTRVRGSYNEACEALRQ